jgi:hypothetical protein
LSGSGITSYQSPPRGAGQIAGDGDRAGQLGQAARQQLALEHADEFVFGVEGVGAHQCLAREAGGGGEQGAFVGAEVVRGVPADQTGPDHAAPAGQRQHGEAAGADLGEGGFQGGAGGPDVGAALAQGRGEGGHGAYRRVGPLGAPLQAPQLGPGLRLGRVQDGDDEPVALQLGERDAVGLEGLAQGGDHGLADVTDGAGGGQGGGQALDAGHVGDVGAQRGGVGDGAHQTGGPALAARQEAAAQSEPLGWAGGLEDPELQLALADGHVVGLDDRHQGGQVLGHGQRQQGLDPAVEVLTAHAEQFQDVDADLDASGVHGEGERVGGQFLALGGPGRSGVGHRVGDEFQARAVVGVEAFGALAHRDQTAPAAVPAGGQGREAEVPRRGAPRLGGLGELLGAQPGGLAGAVDVGHRGPSGGGIAVAHAVQGPRHSDRLRQAQQLAVHARRVHGGEGGPGEDEHLLQDAPQPLG